MSMNQKQAENGGDDEDDDEPLTITNDVQIDGLRISISSPYSDDMIHPGESLTLTAEQMRAYANGVSKCCVGRGACPTGLHDEHGHRKEQSNVSSQT